MIEPLVTEVRLRCSAAHAFATWTGRFGAWWPPGHTSSGEPGATAHLDPRLGGRIFERTPEGREIEWGEVTTWDPPRQLGYRWHIRRPREQATDVLVEFLPEKAATLVRITHTGWERLGDDGPGWRDANRGGWSGLLPHYVADAEQTADHEEG